MTKIGHQKFSALKWKFFPKKVHFQIFPSPKLGAKSPPMHGPSMAIGWGTAHASVHKVRHAIFGQFFPPSPCHTSSHIPGPPKVRHTFRTPRFLVDLVQKPGQKPPLQILSQLFAGVFVRGFCPEWFLSVPPSVRIHLLQQKVKHQFKFQVSYILWVYVLVIHLVEGF